MIYIQHDGEKGHPLETHTKGWEVHPLLKPVEGEAVVRKRESDSFFETTLQQELGKRGITHLIIAGGMTEYCVPVLTTNQKNHLKSPSSPIPTSFAVSLGCASTPCRTTGSWRCSTSTHRLCKRKA